MSNLALHKNQENHLLAANLRRAFSGIVAGNVKDEEFVPSKSMDILKFMAMST